jgi:hypothetical protein
VYEFLVHNKYGALEKLTGGIYSPSLDNCLACRQASVYFLGM